MAYARLACGLGLTLLLTACTAFDGKPKPYAIVGMGSPARHNVEPVVGGALEWPSGAEVELTYRPWFRIEEPSSRGFPEEKMRVFAEAKVPLGK